MDDYLKRKHQLQKKSPELFRQISEVLLKHDFEELYFEDNPDDYDPETTLDLEGIANCDSIEKVCQLVHDAFVQEFGTRSARPVSKYQETSNQMWALWTAQQPLDSSRGHHKETEYEPTSMVT